MCLNNKNLYHFTSIEKLINHIMKTNKLMFNNLNNMNDPKEASTWPFKFYDEVFKTSYLSISIKDFEEIDKYIKSKWLISCFKDESNISNARDINEVGRAYFDMRMWDQYGEKHGGVCIVFDFQKLIESLSTLNQFSVYHGKVKYTSKCINKVEDPFALSFHQIGVHGVNEIMRNQTEKFHDDFFFTKSLSWVGENEYRIALHSRDENAEYFLHDFNDAISGIILGYQVSEET